MKLQEIDMPGLDIMPRVRSDLDAWELTYLYMYLDSVGVATVGCGTALATSDFAATISFHHDLTKKDATKDEIVTAWNELHKGSADQKVAQPKDKYRARHYAPASDLRITITISNRLRDDHVAKDYIDLLKLYPKFDSFPDDAKVALFDMIYNLGAGGLKSFGHMNQAVNKMDWAHVASSCHRAGIAPARNDNTSNLFKNCVQYEKLQTVQH